MKIPADLMGKLAEYRPKRFRVNPEAVNVHGVWIYRSELPTDSMWPGMVMFEVTRSIRADEMSIEVDTIGSGSVHKAVVRKGSVRGEWSTSHSIGYAVVWAYVEALKSLDDLPF